MRHRLLTFLSCFSFLSYLSYVLTFLRSYFLLSYPLTYCTIIYRSKNTVGILCISGHPLFLQSFMLFVFTNPPSLPMPAAMHNIRFELKRFSATSITC